MLAKWEIGERRTEKKGKAGATVFLALPGFSRWILLQRADICFLLPSCCIFQKSLGGMGRTDLYASEVAAGLAEDFPENFNCYINAAETGVELQTESSCLSVSSMGPMQCAAYRTVCIRVWVGECRMKSAQSLCRNVSEIWKGHGNMA